MVNIWICFLLVSVFGTSQQIQLDSNNSDSQDDLFKIVGGEKAEEGEFPYQVSLRFRGLLKMHFCGGSIISERIILTAAHCVTEVKTPLFTYIEVVGGIISLKKEGPNVQKSTILKSIIHPKYPGKVNPYDLAILILKQPFTFNKFVQPVALPQQNEEFSGEAVLTGWGSTSKSVVSSMPDILQKVKLPLMNFTDCADYYRKDGIPVDKFSNICTESTKGHFSACSGDSGGPLVISRNGTNTVVGVVSWGQVPCGTGSPSVYTKVSSFVDFIQEKTSIQKLS